MLHWAISGYINNFYYIFDDNSSLLLFRDYLLCNNVIYKKDIVCPRKGLTGIAFQHLLSPFLGRKHAGTYLWGQHNKQLSQT